MTERRRVRAGSRRPGAWRAPLAATAAALALTACASRGAARAATPAPMSPRAALRAAIDSMIDAPEFRSAHWGVLIVDPANGDTLYSRNAGKLFMPASNQKLLTGATALAQLGPEYRYHTTFAARGRVRGETLDGDLVVVGRGDPTVSDHMRAGDAMAPLRAVADSLAARGIRRITGRIVRGGDAFPDAPLGFGWAWDDLPYAYSAGVDELMFNEGFTRVLLRGGTRSGAAVAAATAPLHGYPGVTVRASTALPGNGGSGAGQPDASWGVAGSSAAALAPGSVVVTGNLAPGDTTTLEAAYPDAAGAYLYAVSEALAARGIAGGRVELAERVPAESLAVLTTLATLESPPLREIMPALEKPSQNQIAEALYKTLGLEKTGVGSADSGRRVVEAQLAAWGAAPDGYAVRDGSGLSRHDYVSPETIVRVLDAMRRDPSFKIYYDALPIAGVDGTIGSRMRGTPAQGNVHAKTGFVDRARSLSGYVTTADGKLVLFSLLCNNWTTPVRAVERVQDEVAARLAALQIGGTLSGAPPAPSAGLARP
ncbi:MAG: D-alanyl-D-alanine carboxypeptidase/D-alanyl-D-alanine-endopeptidase [Gemmatimonadaceae bacterium]